MQARFTALCNVIADTSMIARSLRPQQASGGGGYYRLEFDVILLFGLTELKAQISWNDGVCCIIVNRMLYYSHSVPGCREEVRPQAAELDDAFY